MLLANFERLLNRCIAESTPARRKIRAMDGESMAVEIVGLPIRVVMQAEGGQLELALNGGAETSVTVKAAPLDLLQLLGPDTLVRLKRTRAEITGELHVAESFGELLEQARPDLEEELSRLIGDVPAHALGEGARGLTRWGESAGRSIEFSVSEYLHEESRALPSSHEVEKFCTAVDVLRDDVERIEQRIEILARRLAKAEA